VAKGSSQTTGSGGFSGAALSPSGRYGAGDGWAIIPAWRFRAPGRAANDNTAPLSRRLLRLCGLMALAAACAAALRLLG